MASKPIILVTCAAGTTGKLLVEQLRATSKFIVRAGVRDLEKGMKLFNGLSNVEVVKLDETEEVSKKAFEGIHGLYLIIHAPFPNDTCFSVWFKWAKEVGVKHLVFQSSYTAFKPNIVLINEILSNYQDEILASSVPYTILRPAFFHQNIEKMYLPQIIKGAIIGSSDSVPYSVVDVRDMVAAAVEVFLHPSDHIGHSYKLTGSVTNDSEQAKLLSEALGKPVLYVNLSKAEYQVHLSKTKLPAEYQTLLVQLDDEKREKLALPVVPDLTNIIGRPAITFGQYIKEVVPSLIPPGGL